MKKLVLPIVAVVAVSAVGAANVKEPWEVGVVAAINSDNKLEAGVRGFYGDFSYEVNAREAIYDVVAFGRCARTGGYDCRPASVYEQDKLEWEVKAGWAAYYTRSGWHGPYVNYIKRADGRDTFAGGWHVVFGSK